jgi:hypothetical protein
MPEWIGPAAYLAGVAVLGLFFFVALQFLSDGKDTGLRASQLSKAAVAERQKLRQKIHDTPATAPELSPLYPTPRYASPVAGSQAEAARKVAREERGKERTRRPRIEARDAFAFGGETETSGSSGRSDMPSFFSKPEPSQ